MNDIDQSLHRSLHSFEWLPLVFNTMSTEICPDNCSGHGYCDNGQCICLVQYAGDSCQDKNIGYFIAFGTIFACLTTVALAQLMLRVKTEYFKQKKRSLFRIIMKLNAHKLLYFITILATSIRCIYFFTKCYVSALISRNLWSAYFPLLLSGFSYLVCFWAEAYHLSNIKFSKPRFLSKSFIGFIMFNILLYIVLGVQLVASEVINDSDLSSYILNICNGFFAIMMVLAVIFFLSYGVLMYFKVRGAFTQQSDNHVDLWTLHMSRLGLVTQAAMQLVMALLIMCDITKEMWLDKLPIIGQNFYDIGFRIIEFGVVLWFPCVLWNYKSPEHLWVLNPKRLFKDFNFSERERTTAKLIQEDSSQYANYGAIQQKEDIRHDCWICYDPDREDAGPLIQPCECRGDVASAHHECLRKWLMECANNEDDLKCKVCNHYYELKQKWTWMPKGLNLRHWLQTFSIIIIMVGAPFGAYAVAHSVIITYIRILVIGLSVLVELIAIRVLLKNLGTCLTHGRLSTVSIMGKEVLAVSAKTPSTDKPQTSLQSHYMEVPREQQNDARDVKSEDSDTDYSESDSEICTSIHSEQSVDCVAPHSSRKSSYKHGPSAAYQQDPSVSYEHEPSALYNSSPSSVYEHGPSTSSALMESEMSHSHNSPNRGCSFSVEAVIETNRSVH